MRILYLCTDGIDICRTSGGAVHMRSLIRAWSEIGHEVFVVCSVASTPAALEAEVGARVFPAPRTPWNHRLSHAIAAGNRALGRPTRHNPDAVRVLHNFTFFKVAAEAARELQPDFIYERSTLWGVAGLRLARKRSVPLVLEVNAPLAYEQKRYRVGLTCPPMAAWLERQVWRKADLVIVVSDSLRKLAEKAGVAPDRLRVLPNAVDTRLFHTDLDGQAVRRRFGLDGRFVVGFVGSFKRWHGVDLLLAAFQDLHRVDPITHLLLVGDGPLRPLMEDEVRKAGLGDVVTFAGAVKHEAIPLHLAAMDVAVAPYPLLDDFYYSPLKVFEYMAAGRAVVASRAGQLAEVIVDGVSGLLFQPGDRAGLVDCIARLQQNEALRSALRRNAGALGAKYTWKHNATRVIDWVAPLVGQKEQWSVASG
jgi:glycosyltransferase involved in cell wall biosynthesis